jgi:CPA2 family monovalent cation:H+ antiporter-2
MGQVPHLDQLAVVAAAAVVVAVVLSRWRIPTVAGFLASGSLVGPYGLALVHDTHLIEALAEIGVVLLLFSIGLEFSMARLRTMLGIVFVGGGVQVGLTIAVTVAVGLAIGRSGAEAIFFGFVFALSSTAIVLREVAARRELAAPHGRFVVGALIFQDLCVVPMVMIVPVLGLERDGVGIAVEVAIALAKAAAVVAAAIVLARFLVPRIFAVVDASRSREVFLVAVLAICIGTAFLTSLAGLSLALGAFLAGVVVADTEFGHRAMADVLPLRDVFVSVFFVSLGMLFDPRVLVARPLLTLAFFLGFLVAKGAIASGAALLWRLPARSAWLAGVGLAQFGEFGFVLARLGRDAGVLDADAVSPLFAAGILSMFVAPLLLRIAPHAHFAERLLIPVARLRGAPGELAVAEDPRLSGHVVICGFGIAGKLVARALGTSGVPCVALELNVETVRAARAEGLPVFYGDATSPEALEHAGIGRAAAVVLVLNDPAATERIVAAVRRVAPDVPLLARVHYLAEAQALLKLGATDAVAEEVESGVEIVARVLRRLDIPRNDILDRIEEARSAIGAIAARPTAVPRKTLGEHGPLADLKIESVRLPAGAPAIGRSVRDLDVRRRTGTLVIAICRDGVLLDQSDLDTPLHADDVVFMVGTRPAIESAIHALTEREEPGDGAGATRGD